MALLTRMYDSEYSPPYSFEVEFFGLRYPGDLNCFLDWHVYFLGAYEMDMLMLLRELFLGRKGRVFVDVGANIGHHSLFMSKFAQQIHAFEPWEAVRRAIVEKIDRNRLGNVTVHPVGLGSATGELPYYAPRGANTGTGSFDSGHAVDRNRLLGELLIVNGDDYFERHEIRGVDLIKIDAEGWEKFVLLGLSESLKRDLPLVIVEISESTLASFEGFAEFSRCIPECYDAEYVDFANGRVTYSPFDLSRAGNVLLRPRKDFPPAK